MKFWAAWREEDITDAQMYAIRNHPLSTEQIDALFAHRPPADRNWYQQLIAAGELAVSGQDKLLISLLSPERLLEMTRFFTLFDKRTAKLSPSISRYSVLKDCWNASVLAGQTAAGKVVLSGIPRVPANLTPWCSSVRR